MGSQRRQNADQDGGNRIISTLLSPCLPAGTKGSAQQPIFMRPFAPCFAGSVAGAQVYLRARSVIHNGYSACWNEGEPSIERVNHQRMGSFLREPIPVYEAGGTGSASRHQEPAHLPDVLQALLISGQLLMCFADFHSFFQSVRDVNSSTMSSNR